MKAVLRDASFVAHCSRQYGAVKWHILSENGFTACGLLANEETLADNPAAIEARMRCRKPGCRVKWRALPQEAAREG